MRLKYEYEGKKVLKNEPLLLIIKILFLLVSVCIIGVAVYLVVTNDDTSFFDDEFLETVIVGVILICVLFEILLKNSNCKSKHKKIRQNGNRATGYIDNVRCINDGGNSCRFIEVIVYDVLFEIDGLADNDAFYYIFENRHKLRFVQLPITVYLYNSEIYADLSSVNLHMLETFSQVNQSQESDNHPQLENS